MGKHSSVIITKIKYNIYATKTKYHLFLTQIKISCPGRRSGHLWLLILQNSPIKNVIKLKTWSKIYALHIGTTRLMSVARFFGRDFFIIWCNFCCCLDLMFACNYMSVWIILIGIMSFSNLSKPFLLYIVSDVQQTYYLKI